MRASRYRTWMTMLVVAAAWLRAVAPLAAQGAPPTPPRTTARAQRAAGIPQEVLMSAVTGTIATFRQSFEVSLDGVHWSKAITAPFPNSCTPATASACAPGTSDVRVYARWIPLPKVDMSHVHLDGMTGPYRIQTASTRAEPVCESGASYPLPSSGFPVTIRAAEPGGRFPMTCTWVVQAVVARAPGSTPAYEIVQSNPASVTLTFRK